MVGCRHNAKNSLDKNYLFLAQKRGAKIQAESKVYDVQTRGPEDGSQGYKIFWRNSLSFLKGKGTYTCKGIVFAGGVLGTVPLLLKLREKSLPNLSRKAGCHIRTNSESLS